MTCEVAVLNKYAAVMAADSAVTYTNGLGEERYTKGGNKIFQMSHHAPIGVMIYDSGSFLGVPWEIVIKDYRARLGKKTFGTVSEYAADFLGYIQQNTEIFPDQERDNDYVLVAGQIAVHIISDAVRIHPELADVAADQLVRKAIWDAYVAGRRAAMAPLTVDRQQALNGIAQRVVNELRPSAEGALATLATEGRAKLDDVADVEELILLAIDVSFRSYATYSSNTGIVFCGYGTKQHFPEIVEHILSGFVAGELIYRDGKKAIVTRQQPSQIMQFATTSMVDVFTRGYGYEMWVAVERAFQDKVSSLVSELMTATNGQLPADYAQLWEKTQTDFRKSWTDELFDSNYVNLRSNIGTLPIDEMVHLAETMIVLESLKEKVTSPSQSVGGPVDVAAITRSEGLVWVKRKEYFASAKNPHYVLRQQQHYRAQEQQ
jgi:hypothetical protein